MPTRLGNALKAMETYGDETYGLDSQSLWYELQAVAPSQLRSDTSDARAAVDFFISSIAHLALLAPVALGAGIATQALGPIILGFACLGLLYPMYLGAVRNVGEWRSTIQALVNLGRLPLAEAMGLRLPDSFARERKMWENFTDMVNYGPDDNYLRVLNGERTRRSKTEASVQTQHSQDAGSLPISD